jgi:hypothetical protein
MEGRDYLLDELNRAGRVLANILSRITGQPTQGITVAETTTAALQDELDWDLAASLSLPEETFIAHLTDEKGFDDQQLGMLSQLLEALGDSITQPEQAEMKRRYYARSLHICAHLERHSRIYSFDRAARMERLMEMLSLD